MLPLARFGGGIVDEEHVRRTAERCLAGQMFPRQDLGEFHVRDETAGRHRYVFIIIK